MMAGQTYLAAVLAAISLAMAAATQSTAPPSSQFCIVGAGPGGVQAAHLMKQYGMEFVLFERGPTVGSFFVQYPRQRKLISINKVHTGQSDPEFNLRHDWNSLLTEPADAPSAQSREPLLFKNFSSAYFPSADRLVEYLAAFVEYNDLSSHVYLSHNVVRITRAERFIISWAATVRDGDTDAVRMGSTECDVVVMASGKDVPVIPRSAGVEWTKGCYEIPTDPKLYTNQEILVLGAGNSALEFIQSVEDYTASVHLASRYPMKLSFQSHYVGHARALNLGILDKYQLKSLDVLLAGMDVGNLQFSRDPATSRIRIDHAPVPADSVLPSGPSVVTKSERVGGFGGSGRTAFPAGPFRRGYDQVIHCLGFTWDRRPFASPPSPEGEEEGAAKCSASEGDGCGAREKGTASKTGALITPAEDREGKFASVASNFESVNVPDLFVAGTLMHYRDFKKSAGGFIHGFRYSVRTLVRQLRERYLGVPYPELRVGPCPRGVVGECSQLLVDHFAKRLARTSSLYQLQSVLSDVVYVILREDKQLEFGIIEDVPLDMVASAQPSRTNMKSLAGLKSFLTVSLEFGRYFQGTGILYHQSQPETASRTREKMLWTPDAEPDALIGSAAASSASDLPAKKTMKAPRAAPFELLEGYLPVQTGEDSLNLFNDGDPVPGVPKESLMGFQFLHPVVRQWRRAPDTTKRRPDGNATLVKADIVSEYHMREDVNNDWTDPDSHGRPLRKYLSDLLPSLRLLARA